MPRWLAPTRAATCHKLTLQLSRHGGRGGGEVAVMVNSCAERVAAALVRSGGWVRRARSTVQRCCGRHTPPRSLLAAWSLTGGHLLAAEDAKSRSRASQRTLRHGTQPAVPHGRERRCVRLVRSSDLRPEWLCYKARGPCWRSEIGVARRVCARRFGISCRWLRAPSGRNKQACGTTPSAKGARQCALRVAALWRVLALASARRVVLVCARAAARKVIL